MKDLEKQILKKLVVQLEKLIELPESKRIKIAENISEQCKRVLMKKDKDLSDETEGLLESCLDLDHWGWDKIPPTLSLEEIKKKVIPKIKQMKSREETNKVTF